jgi:dephospho-CoA kinase
MTYPFRLGLTGSIGMGKSTTAALFTERGCAVWDADAAVHRLYAPGGAAVDPIAALCPAAKGPDGIDRMALKDWIAHDPTALARLEAVVHPLVARDRSDWAASQRTDIVVFDIPLLFETGTDREMHATAVVSAPADMQRARVLSRPGMTPEDFARILARQVPDADKRARADYVIDTSSHDSARRDVDRVLERIRSANA